MLASLEIGGWAVLLETNGGVCKVAFVVGVVGNFVRRVVAKPVPDGFGGVEIRVVMADSVMVGGFPFGSILGGFGEMGEIDVVGGSCFFGT